MTTHLAADAPSIGQPPVPGARPARPVYLDCNATSPVDPRVRDEVMHYLDVEFGNAGSRTHGYGQSAKERVQQARREVAAVVDAQPDEVLFTSGATESDNLALLGLAPYAERSGRRHIVTTQIEHKAVLEPVDHLRSLGFEVTEVAPTSGGWVDPQAIASALRADTVLVSVMHVNNETGVIQPLGEITELLAGHETFFHVDAAQGFGKDLAPLRNRRIDLISVSGHKIYGPKGIGALIARRRGYQRVPLQPLMHGGGQERGLRPGTVPVHLVAGLGTAARLALQEADQRNAACTAFRERALATLEALGAVHNGDPERTVAHTLNVSLPALNSEAVMLALKPYLAISNGSACTSQSYDPSHVLEAMGLPRDRIQGALRLSWCHSTDEPAWESVQEAIRLIN